jgi:hypothetical protein
MTPGCICSNTKLGERFAWWVFRILCVPMCTGHVNAYQVANSKTKAYRYLVEEQHTASGEEREDFNGYVY